MSAVYLCMADLLCLNENSNSALQQFLNKMDTFLIKITISKNILVLNMFTLNNLCKQYGSRSGTWIVGPDLRSILFDTQHQFLLTTGCIAWAKLNSEDMHIMSVLQIVWNSLEGTVFCVYLWKHGTFCENKLSGCTKNCDSICDSKIYILWTCDMH